jgi:hypothetical protein
VLAGEAPAVLKPQSPAHQRWFGEAVLLWTHFAEAGGDLLVDTHRSEILRCFRPDLRAGPGERAAIRAALARTFGWSELQLDQLESAVRVRISNLLVKNAIARALAAELTRDGAPGTAAACRRLFQRLFGPVPFRPGEVTLTLTTTTLIIGLPFEDGQLIAAEQPPRPEADRRAIEAFLALVDKHKNSFDTLRFPGFGLYDRSQVDPTLLTELTAAVTATPGLDRVRAQVVTETLASMVTLVPGQQAELFLLHDIWGHGWEESLADFEWSYARLLELREPVHAATGPLFAGEEAPALRQAFQAVDGRTLLDAGALRTVVEADLRGRITVGLNVVVSEALADLVEHKYQRRRGPGDPPLPSSSLFPDAPLKLDLSLRDTQMLLKAAHRSYRRLLERPAEAERLRAELAAAGLPGPGLPEAVDQALALIRSEFAHVLATGFQLPAEGGGRGKSNEVNLAQRVMLGMVGLQAALVDFLDRAEARCGDPVARQAEGTLWRCPSACLDLLVLLLGTFYEQDRRLFFWHLDELLRDELGPTLARFEAALNETPP